MSSTTAADMIQAVRDMANAYDEAMVFDGYPADDSLYRSGPRILPLINRKIVEMQRHTGFNRCYIRVDLISGQQEYILPNQVQRIILAEVIDNPVGRTYALPQTTVQELQYAHYSAWRSQEAYRPLHFYTLGARGFGLFPIPNTDGDITSELGCTVSFLCETLPVEMTSATDQPATIYDDQGIPVTSGLDGFYESSLPEGFDLVPCYGAAAEVARMLGDKDRYADLWAQWEKGLEDLRGATESRVSADIQRVPVYTGRRRSYDFRKLVGLQ